MKQKDRNKMKHLPPKRISIRTRPIRNDKRVNEILDEAVQNNAIEQQRAETAEESDLNKALYESQQLFEDNKTRHTKDILYDVVEKSDYTNRKKYK